MKLNLSGLFLLLVSEKKILIIIIELIKARTKNVVLTHVTEKAKIVAAGLWAHTVPQDLPSLPCVSSAVLHVGSFSACTW